MLPKILHLEYICLETPKRPADLNQTFLTYAPVNDTVELIWNGVYPDGTVQKIKNDSEFIGKIPTLIEINNVITNEKTGCSLQWILNRIDCF